MLCVSVMLVVSSLLFFIVGLYVCGNITDDRTGLEAQPRGLVIVLLQGPCLIHLVSLDPDDPIILLNEL